MIEIYRDRDNIEKTPGHSLYHIIQAIDCELEDCAERAYNLSALDTGKPKQNLWIRDAGFYLNNGISGFSMYTSYGSAATLAAFSLLGRMQGNGLISAMSLSFSSVEIRI